MNIKHQKGFVIPLVIAIIAILVVGGIGYASYEKGKSTQMNRGNEQPSTSTTTNDNAYTNTTQASSTITWKKYTDNDPGFVFSVDYPSGYIISSPGPDKYYTPSNYSIFSVSFYPSSSPDSDGMSLMITHNDPVSFDQHVKEFLDLSKILGANAKIEQEPNITINGISATVIKLSSPKENGTHIILQSGNARYKIVGGDLFANDPVFKHFYQSFKFTN